MAGWEPTTGDNVKIVGLHGYDGQYGKIIDRAGSGLFRVELRKTGIVVGAARQQLRKMDDLEVLAQEAPSVNDDSACGRLLVEMQRRADTNGGITGATWREAAEKLKHALQQDRGR